MSSAPRGTRLRKPRRHALLAPLRQLPDVHPFAAVGADRPAPPRLRRPAFFEVCWPKTAFLSLSNSRPRAITRPLSARCTSTGRLRSACTVSTSPWWTPRSRKSGATRSSLAKWNPASSPSRPGDRSATRPASGSTPINSPIRATRTTCSGLTLLARQPRFSARSIAGPSPPGSASSSPTRLSGSRSGRVYRRLGSAPASRARTAGSRSAPFPRHPPRSQPGTRGPRRRRRSRLVPAAPGNFVGGARSRRTAAGVTAGSPFAEYRRGGNPGINSGRRSVVRWVRGLRAR